MTTRVHVIMLALIASYGLAMLACAQNSAPQSEGDSGFKPQGIEMKIVIAGAKYQARLVRGRDGAHHYELLKHDGTVETLSPEEFARRLFSQDIDSSILALIFNISSPIGLMWVAIGLLGQCVFAGRMIVQWLASEKRKRSVVPPAFWWMSIAGALMLLAYFLWRRDAVGVLGQATGLAIYLRNIHLIYRPRQRPCPRNGADLSVAIGETNINS